MSIRWRNGRPIVEVYSAKERRKVHVKAADFGMKPPPAGTSKRELTRWALELEEKALDAKPKEETCDSFAERWPQDFPRADEVTAIKNAEAVRKFGKDFEGRPLRSITREEARKWARENEWRRAKVRAMFNDALEEGLVDENPFANLKLPSSRGRKDIIPLTYEEVMLLGQTALEVHGSYGPEFRAMILFAAFTAMRPGEIFAARHSLLSGDLYDLRRQYSTVLKREKEPKKDSTGVIYVPKEAREAVASLPRRLGDDVIFRTKTGCRFNTGTLHYVWDPVRRAFVAQLPTHHHLREREEPLDFYELRHFGASYMLNVLGFEPWVIAKQLRHSDGGVRVVQLYGHPDRDRAIEIMREGFGG